MPRIVIYLFKFVLLFAAYFTTAKIGLSLDAVSGFATLVWPPTGISLATLVLFGTNLWPAIFLAAFLVNLTTGAPPAFALGIGVGNTLEALVATFFITRFTKVADFLDHTKDVFIFVLFAGFISTAISATIGVTSLYLGGIVSISSFAQTWLAWWVGDMLGALIIAPLILTWGKNISLQPFKLSSSIEVCILILTIVTINGVLFLHLLGYKITSSPIAYVAFLPLLWMTLRFGKKAVTASIFLTATIAIIGTTKGMGPFTLESNLSKNLEYLQLFLGVVFITTLSLSATVSERKKVKKSLEILNSQLDQKVKDQTAALQEAQQIARVGSWEWDIITNKVKWSDEMYRIYGYKPKEFEVTFEKANERVDPQDLNRIQKNIQNVFQKRQNIEASPIEYTIILPSGEKRILYGKGKVIVDKSGNPIKMIGTVQDVTQMRIAEQDLKKYQLAVEDASDHITITDLNGIIIYANPAVERITGFPLKEVIGKKAGSPELWGGLMDKDFYKKLWQTIKVEKKAFNGEIKNKRKDGSEFYTLASIYPVLDENKNVAFFVENHRDITKEKELQRIRERQLKHEVELEQKERDFVSLASHQLLTPLTLISGYISMLISGKLGKINAEAKKYLEESFQSTQSMSDLVKHLLATSRIESGNIKLEKTNFDLNQLARNIFIELKPKLDAKGLTYKLPTKANRILVRADKEQTRQVIINILDNAIKYTKSGVITLDASSKNGMGRISISDTGIGISKEALPHIFEKFYMSQNWLLTQSESHRLGLYISKLLLDLIGGTIFVESKEGQGTTLTVALPLAKNG